MGPFGMMICDDWFVGMWKILLRGIPDGSSCQLVSYWYHVGDVIDIGLSGDMLQSVLGSCHMCIDGISVIRRIELSACICSWVISACRMKVSGDIIPFS